MSNTGDTRAMFSALLNHIPATMQATRAVLAATTAGLGEDALPPGIEKVVRELGRQVSALNVSVLILENRLERLDGREGLPEEAMVAIMSEFGR